MKKKFLTLIFTLTAMLMCIFSLTACGDTKISFKLNFVVDNEIYATIDTSGDEVIALPENPTKENHFFDGWFWDKDVWEKPFTTNSLLDAPLSSDMSVYAKFSLNTINGVTFEDIETTYDGTEKTIAVSNLPNGASVVYDKANTYTNAGEYTVTATISQENQEDLQLTAVLTINKATYDMSGVVFTDKIVIYNSESHSITATNLPDGVTAQYTGNNQTYAGEYTVTATFTGDSANYELIPNKTATLTILDSAFEGLSFESKTFTYDGTEKKIEVVGAPSDATITYNKANTYINAGEYTITATIKKANYVDVSLTATLTINKATYDMSQVVFADKTVTYNGNVYSIEAQNVPSGLSVSYTGNNKTDVDTYTVTAIFTDTTGNYNNPENMTAKLVVNKATITGITLTDKTFTYDAKTHSLAIDGTLPTCVNVTYENNDKVNANTYTVTVSFEDTSGNYIVPNNMSAKLIINKATVSGITFEDKTFTYNGTKRNLEISGTLPNEVTVNYVNNGKVNANTYYVTATFSCETDNYIMPEDMTAKLTIKKAVYDMSNVTFKNKTVTYDGKTHSLAVSDNLPNGVSVSYTNNDKINADQYVVTATFTGDSINYYAIDDMQAMLTINKATYDMSGVSFVGGRFTYDGTQKFIYVAGELPEGVTVNYTNNGKINANTYTVTATFTGDTNNYNKLPDWTASLIINKATYDMSGISFKNQTFTYDATEKNALITGTLPNGVEVSYVGNGKTDVGAYTVTAKFNGDSNNYHLISNMTATLKINQAVPYIKEVSCNQSLNVYSTVELIADTEVAGTIVFDNGQTLALGYKSYSWTFIPEDTHNYTNATGTVGLTVCALVSYYNDGVLFSSQNIVLNNSATVPTGTPIREDSNGYRYTFSHWSIEENGAEYNFINAITADLNLYAVYDSEEIVYAINYYNTKGVEHENIATYTVSTQFTLLSLEKEHYVFNGWTDKGGNEVTKINKGTFGTLDLYAMWTPIEYAITYDLGYRGAVNGNNPTTYNVEDSFSFVNAAYDEYHTFAGWYLEENYINKKSSISVGESGTITLYAKWNFSGTYISTASELQNMAYNMRGVYELKNDIDLTNTSWTPIGDSTNPFTGYFNGADYSINGKTPFDTINGTVKNLKSNLNIAKTNNGTVTYCVGGKGLIIYNSGIIKYCNSEGYVTYDDYTASLVAYNIGQIEQCFAKASFSLSYSVSGTSRGSVYKTVYVGGLVGYSSKTIFNSYVVCDLSIEGVASKYVVDPYYGGGYGSGLTVYIGGVCAVGQVENCYSTGRISTSLRVSDRNMCYAQAYIYSLNKGNSTNSFSNMNYDVTSTSYNNSYQCVNTNTTQAGAIYTSNYNLTSKTFLTETIGFSAEVWMIKDGALPTLAFESEK